MKNTLNQQNTHHNESLQPLSLMVEEVFVRNSSPLLPASNEDEYITISRMLESSLACICVFYIVTIIIVVCT